MKKMVYVMALLLLCVGAAFAQYSSLPSDQTMQNANAGFRSTSTLTGSGSSLPSAASAGVTTTDEAYGPRRISNRRNGDFDTSPEGGSGDSASPVGEPWVLLFFAAAAAGVIYLRKRNAHNKAQA